MYDSTMYSLRLLISKDTIYFHPYFPLINSEIGRHSYFTAVFLLIVQKTAFACFHNNIVTPLVKIRLKKYKASLFARLTDGFFYFIEITSSSFPCHGCSGGVINRFLPPRHPEALAATTQFCPFYDCVYFSNGGIG